MVTDTKLQMCIYGDCDLSTTANDLENAKHHQTMHTLLNFCQEHKIFKEK